MNKTASDYQCSVPIDLANNHRRLSWSRKDQGEGFERKKIRHRSLCSCDRDEISDGRRGGRHEDFGGTPPTVFIVHEDQELRYSIASLLHMASIYVETFVSVDRFLQVFDPDRSGCIVTDVSMSGVSGIEFLRALVSHGSRIPILMLTARADARVAIDAMREGTVSFIEKPYLPRILLDRVQQAIARR